MEVNLRDSERCRAKEDLSLSASVNLTTDVGHVVSLVPAPGHRHGLAVQLVMRYPPEILRDLGLAVAAGHHHHFGPAGGGPGGRAGGSGSSCCCLRGGGVLGHGQLEGWPAGRRRGGPGEGTGELATVIKFTHQSLRVHRESYICYCIQIDKIYTKR